MYDETDSFSIGQQQQQSQSNSTEEGRTCNPIASQIVVDWEVAQAILYVIQERTSLLIGHQLKLDEDIHIETFHALFLKDRLGFWTIIDQLHDYLLTLDWSRVLDDIALIQHLLHTLKPVKCTLTEAEFVQILLLKLWPQPSSAQPIPNEINTNDVTNDVINDVTYDVTDDVIPDEYEYEESEEDEEEEEEEEERQRLARNEVIRLAVENVYTWEAVEKIIVLVNERITAKVGREIRFDQKHIEGLFGLYERDPLCFWSVFDQIQDKMMKSDWTKVRNDARFIQSFMNKYEPIDVLLTPFMADAIPQHSLVPKAYPPHVLYKKDISTFKPIQKENCLYNSKYYRKQQLLRQEQQQQQQDLPVQDGMTSQQDNVTSSPRHPTTTSTTTTTTTTSSKYQRQVPYPPCQFSQYNYFQDQIQQDQSKSNSISSSGNSSNSQIQSQSSKITANTYNSTNSNSNGYNTNPSRMNTNNYNNDTNPTIIPTTISLPVTTTTATVSPSPSTTTTTTTTTISSSSSSDIKSKPYQRYQQNNTTTTTNNTNTHNTNNSNNNNRNNYNNHNNYNNYNNNTNNGNNNNNNNNNGSKQVHFVYSWSNAQSAINEIEKQVMDNFSSVDVVFEECHRAALRARWEADPKGFFSVLDQINTKFSLINWNTVTTKTKYINSIIAKYEPQSVLSRFIQKFITPPEVAAATARVEGIAGDFINVSWESVIDTIIPAIEQNVSQAISKEVHFDEKHILHLKQRYDRDVVSFLSVLDQVQDKMLHAEWTNVRDSCRFIQSFITKVEPKFPLNFTPFLFELLFTIKMNSDEDDDEEEEIVEEKDVINDCFDQDD